MTPAQKAALEALVERTLSEAEVLQVTSMLAEGRFVAIAALLSVGHRTVQPRMTTVRGMDSTLPGGAAQAETIMLKLEGARDYFLSLSDTPENAEFRVFGSVLRRRLRYIDGDDGLDFGAPALREMLDRFQAQNILTAEEVQALKSIALQPATITDAQVRAALDA